MTRPYPINRETLVECIACRNFIQPEERLQRAYFGGHNVRFYVCLRCIADYRKLSTCSGCGVVLTVHNRRLVYGGRGRITKTDKLCIECYRADNRIRMRINRKSEGVNALYDELIRNHPNILK